MPQALQDYINHMEHAIGGVPDTRINPAQVANEALRYLFDQHPWSFRERPILEILTTPGQNYITLPADFGELVSVHFDTREVSLTSLEDIAHRRANTLIPPPLAAVYVAVSWPGQPNTTSLQNATASYTQPTTPPIASGSLVASATDSLGSAYTPNFTLDGNSLTYWEAATAYDTTGFFKLDMGSSQTVGYLFMQAIDAFPTQFPPAGIVETSPDDSAWTQVGTWDVTTSQWNPANQRVTVTWSAASARYVRMRPSADMSVNWAMQEVGLAPGSQVVSANSGPLLEIFPNVTSTDGYTIDYRAGAILLVNTTDVPNIPPSFERLLALLARAFMCDYEEQNSTREWDAANAEIERLKEHDAMTQQNSGLIRGGAVNERRRRVNFWVGGINPR